MATRISKDTIDGFAVHTLENQHLRISIVPELGGRVVSIHDLAAQREWLDGWQPSSERRLWKPTDPAVYDSGPGAGIDECLPTVLPCRVGNSELPDHGDLWSSPAQFDLTGTNPDSLKCHWGLSSMPLRFEREITLDGTSIRFRYQLENLASGPTPFLWAWHPLFHFEPGDEMRFDPSVTECLTPEGHPLPWPEALPGQNLSLGDTGTADPAAAKVFVGPLSDGRATILGHRSRLSLEWPADLFPWAGIWITRGAWKGLHHWAFEPTNAPVDRLSDVTRVDEFTRLAEKEVRRWELRLQIGPR